MCRSFPPYLLNIPLAQCSEWVNSFFQVLAYNGMFFLSPVENPSLPRLREHSAYISVARMLMLIKTRNSNPTSPKLAEDWEQIKLTSVMIHV